MSATRAGAEDATFTSPTTLRHLDAIHRLTSATVAATTVESIYQSALDALIGSWSADRAAVLLCDPDGVMRFKAWRGLSDAYRAMAEGHSPWAGNETDPQPVTIADVAHDATLGPLRENVLAEGIGALAFIPLLYGPRLLGKFMLYRDQPHEFGPDELALARTVAGHIAFALEKRRLEGELRVAADSLVATLNAVGEGITVQNPDGTLLLANEAAAAMLGFDSVADLLAAPLTDVATRFELLDERGGRIGPEHLPGRSALQGNEPPESMIRWRLTHEGRTRYSLVKARPVRDDEGGVRFAVNVFRDVTDRQAALEALRTSEARFAFLASAGRALLTSALDSRRVLDRVAELVVPALADWCVVRELGENGQPDRVAARPILDRTDRTDRTDRADGAWSPADGVDGRDGVDAAGGADEDPMRARLGAGHPLLLGDITPTGLGPLTPDEEHQRLLQALGVGSAMLVPLRARGRTIGQLSLARVAGRTPYVASDLALAEELAARVAATVDNARSFARERATADTLARTLLPGRLPAVPGLEVAAAYRAAGNVGGDFYDCFPVGDGTWLLVVGDVCGRGIQAASMTGLTRHTIRAAALHSSSPTAILGDLNRLLLDAAQEDMAAWGSSAPEAEPSFCTVCVASITPTPAGARVVVGSAGHPLPYVVRAEGDVHEVGVPGTLLGVVDDFTVREEAIDLGPGDAMVLFTDGITERRHEGRMFDQDLVATLRAGAGTTAGELALRVEAAAVEFAAVEPDDDMAVLTVSVPRAPRTA